MFEIKSKIERKTNGKIWNNRLNNHFEYNGKLDTKIMFKMKK